MFRQIPIKYGKGTFNVILPMPPSDLVGQVLGPYWEAVLWVEDLLQQHGGQLHLRHLKLP